MRKSPASAQPAHQLNDLIEIARDGERFYLDAASRVRSAQLRSVFRELAEVRQRLIDDLARHVSARGEAPSQHATAWGRTRKLYARVLAAIRSDEEAAYIGELEQAEDRLLERYRSALEHAPTEEIRRVLQRHLLTVKAAHDSMKALKDQIEVE